MTQRNVGIKNGFWKGGRSVASNGYVLVRVGRDHHLADVRGYAYEHRVQAEKKLGRRLRAGEIVHHLDGNKQNNVDTNLEVLESRAKHHAKHRKHDSGLRLPGEPNPTVACTCGCGGRFKRFDNAGRPREFISGHNPHPSPTADAILAVLLPGALARSEISRQVGKRLSVVGTALYKLKNKGKVQQVKQGVWGVSNG